MEEEFAEDQGVGVGAGLARKGVDLLRGFEGLAFGQ